MRFSDRLLERRRVFNSLIHSARAVPLLNTNERVAATRADSSRIIPINSSTKAKKTRTRLKLIARFLAYFLARW